MSVRVEENLTIGSVGIGADASDAELKAFWEWIALFGLPLCRVMADAAPDYTFAGQNVYAGITEIRGTEKAGDWLNRMR